MSNDAIAVPAPGANSKSSFLPLAMIAGMFFIFGFVTWLNGSLMPYLEVVLALTPFQASFILFSFYIAVTVFSLPSSWIIRKVGYKNGMAIGLATMASAALIYIPAAKTHWFGMFLVGQFMMGAGQTLVQTAVNPYVVKMGPEESAARRISIMGILNKSAGIVAPIVFTALILGGMTGHPTTTPTPEEIEQMASNLVLPYIYMALVIGAVAFLVKFSSLPELESEDDSSEKLPLRGALQFPNLVLGVIALFLYVGVEVIAGDTIGAYGRSIGFSNFSILTSITMTCMVIGYILGILLIPRVISQQNMLLVSAALGVFISLCIVFGSNESTSISSLFAFLGAPAIPNTILCIALLGLANAIVWPAIWPLALSGLGKYTATGSALLIMAIAGGAVVPVIMGALSTVIDRQTAYIVMTPCYLFILFYAAKGYKLRSWK
ncbi:N-acetylglucosamine MFS transporter NagP [Cellvibrio fibrivorans]|uniref:Glucose/galactose transporter n=1 Tax=Cellvibrio fibrivorans TaxID=126350 RepID=A0ABU1V2E4_9GAMM|nr:sugar MFS transporter [Cellvibrio fibrivorans]MDR7091622.1 glucose/galactose transporter [Cellvibrio fibrivorans]